MEGSHLRLGKRKAATSGGLFTHLSALVRDVNQELFRDGRPIRLEVVQVSWQDCSRFQGSCWGSQIADVVLMKGDGDFVYVVRPANFDDPGDTVPLHSIKVPCDGSGEETAVAALQRRSSSLVLHGDEMAYIRKVLVYIPVAEQEDKAELFYKVDTYNKPGLFLTFDSNKTSTTFLNRKGKVAFVNEATGMKQAIGATVSAPVAGEGVGCCGALDALIQRFDRLANITSKSSNIVNILQLPLVKLPLVDKFSWNEEDDGEKPKYRSLSSNTFQVEAKAAVIAPGSDMDEGAVDFDEKVCARDKGASVTVTTTEFFFCQGGVPEAEGAKAKMRSLLTHEHESRHSDELVEAGFTWRKYKELDSQGGAEWEHLKAAADAALLEGLCATVICERLDSALAMPVAPQVDTMVECMKDMVLVLAGLHL